MMSKLFAVTGALALSVALSLPQVASAADKKFGDTKFIAYEGSQDNWPTGEAAQVMKDHAVPIYIGLPDKSYKVLGRIYDPRKSGFGIVGRAFAEGLFPESDRQRDVANQAKHRGSDAVLVTSNEKIIKIFKLDKDELEDTAPLFDHKDKIVLAIKFDSVSPAP